MSRLPAWLRVALIDLRGDIRRFAILLACLALGVGTIAAVGSVGASLQAAIERDARVILGGDLEIRALEHDADLPARQSFAALGEVARVVELGARASKAERSAFLNLRAVSANYPLLGAVVTGGEGGGQSLAELLEVRDGVPGAVVDADVLARLGLGIGDTIEIGISDYEARATLVELPDQAAQGFQFGLPVLIGEDTLAEAGLDAGGALTRFRYKIALLPGLDFEAAKTRLEQAHPGADWEIRAPRDATANLARFFDLFSRFLVLVGLSSLLVGGVGVSNAVSSYVNERQSSIATLRSLGATGRLVLVHFLTQIMLLSLLGVLLGLLLGGASSVLALPVLSGMLAIDLPPALDWGKLLEAAGFGLLIAFAFAFLPLRRAEKLRPATLFRAAGAGFSAGLTWREMVHWKTLLPLVVALGGIGGLAISATGEPMLVLWYAIGAVLAFAILRVAAFVLQWVLRLVPPLPSAMVRQAFNAVHRPGAPAPVVILSLGLGLALLLMITLLDQNLRNQIGGAIAEDAPSFVLLDIKPDQLPEIEAFAAADPAVAEFSAVSMLRGTIESVKGVPAAELGPLPDDIADMFEGDTALSWARAVPEGSRVVSGEWWAPDYSGPPLVSISAEMAEPLGLAIGDPMRIAIAGRVLDVSVGNVREIDWREGNGLQFRLLFSPGLVENAPQSFMGSIKAAEGQDAAVESALVRAFPQLTFLPVGDALERVAEILGSLANAVALVGSLAVISGVFVLAGALSVGRRQRESDAVVMKVLGATRRDVVLVFLLEYGLLGALSALLATGLGLAGAWAILTYVLEIPFAPDWSTIALVIGGAIALTVVTGMATTWSALSVRPARRLREEML